MNKMTHKHDDILSLYETYLNTDLGNLKSGDLHYLDIDTVRLGDYLTTCHRLDPDHSLMKLVQRVNDNLGECIGEPTEEQENNIIKSVEELIEELRNFNNFEYISQFMEGGD